MSRNEKPHSRAHLAPLRRSRSSAPPHARRALVKKSLASFTTLLLTLGLLSLPSPALAASPAAVNLGTAATYSVLMGGALTNAGVTTLSGDLGFSPAGAITNSGTLNVTGTTRNGGTDALQAMTDMQAAYNDAAGRTSNGPFPGTAGGRYIAGVYTIAGASAPVGDITLDGENNPNSVFIFQIDGALAPGANNRIILVNGAQPGNVFWQVNGAVSPAAGSSFVGTIMAVGAASLGPNATVQGRILVTAAVSLSTNTITTSTPATAPGVPTSVTAAAGNAQATVSWTTPSNNGGSATTGYTVTSSPGGVIATTTGATSVAVPGLTNGTPYTFTVTATNTAGTSLASAPSVAVTPAAAPGPNVDVPPSIAAGVPTNGSVGTQYSSFTVPASGFPAPTFAVTAGALPAGLVLSASTGRITGTPTTAGMSTFTITASNGVGTPAAATYAITVTAPTVSLELNFLPGSNIRDALVTVSASGLKIGSEFSIVMRSTPVIVHSGTVGSTGAVNWRGSLPAGVPAGAHSLTLNGVGPDDAVLTAVAWFSYNASGEIIATSRTGPVPDPAPAPQVPGGAEAAPAKLAATGSLAPPILLVFLALMVSVGGTLLVVSARRGRRSPGEETGIVL
jgi:hypothetical protein